MRALRLVIDMNILIIKHVEIEGPGLIEYSLMQEKILYQILNINSEIRLTKLDDLTHIVILGGPMNAYEEDRHPFLKVEDLFIKEAMKRGKAILGICLGAQLIAKALGAKVFKASMKEIGWCDVSLTEEGSRDPLFSFLPETFPVFQWHEDTFEIPRGAKLMATSSPITHQAFRYAENVYGLQFHLEVTEEMIKDWMFTYEGELGGYETLLFSKMKLLTDTAIEIENYTRRGMKFLKNFFKE
jgi:GMP synthase (glutamine-hydrolysing)